MSSLLKYRFQKKESDKLEGSGTSTPTNESSNGSTQSAEDLNTPTTSQICSSQGSIASENSASQSSGRSLFETFTTPEKKAPLQKVSHKRGAMVIGSDSESDSPVKSMVASPWLSKSSGLANGVGSNQEPAITKSQATVRDHNAFKEEERELYSNLASLQEMYPGVSRPKLVEALASCCNNIDQAVDWIINHQNEEGNSRKRNYNRIRQMSEDSNEGSPSQPVQKKARPLEYSESQDSGGEQREGMSNEEKQKFLSEAFPNFPKDILNLTLQSKDYNLERASDALSSSGLFPTKNSRQWCPNADLNVGENGAPSKELEPPILTPMVSPTENVGSIKAYHYNYQQRMSSTNHDDRDSPPTVYGRPHASPSNGKARNGNTMSRAQRAAKREDMDGDMDGDYSGGEYDSDSDPEDKPSDPVLNFFNSGSLEELVSMDGCSKKKAEVILKVRPFDSWDDLTLKFEQSKELTWAMINACKGVLRMRGTVNKLMQKCERIASNMELIVSELTGKTTIEEGDADRGYATCQPITLSENMKLKPYQMVGLNWLNLMHRQDLNGILGDEMGLGKTIQTIAFMAKLVEDGDKGPHVIVVPSSTIDNWLRELHIWCPTLKVLLYYGSQDERRLVRMQLMDENEECNVLVTTYNMASGTVEDRQLFKKSSFHYAVFDEGHMLKNMSSIRYQSLMKINASRRLLLTGTPLQNNLVELMSLLAFVMPDLFSGKTDQVKKIFTSISSRSNYETKGDYEKQTIGQAKGILKPFFLRRLKRDVLQQLPSKVDVIEKVSMAFEQADLYEDLKNSFTKKIKSESKDGVKTAGSAMLMQLRKAANHHLLHRREYDLPKLKQMAKLMCKEPTHVNSNVDFVYEDMEVMSDFELHKLCLQYKGIRKFSLDEEQIIDTGKFRYISDLLPTLKEKGSRVLLFSQFTMMLDIIEDYMHAKGHEFIRLDGQTPVAERQELIDQFNTNTDIFVFLLSTKAGGLGINLTAADTVILHDLDFNPYNDKQAEDRCHRVGQTRDVTVYRLISKNTVEEAILRCAQAKLQLEQDVTGQSATAKEEENPSDVASLLQEALAIDAD